MLKVVGGDCARPGARGSTGGGAGLGAASRCRARWVSRVPVSSAVSRADNVHRYLSSLRRGGGRRACPPSPARARALRAYARVSWSSRASQGSALWRARLAGARAARARARRRARARKINFGKHKPGLSFHVCRGCAGGVWGVCGFCFRTERDCIAHETCRHTLLTESTCPSTLLQLAQSLRKATQAACGCAWGLCAARPQQGLSGRAAP